MYITLKMKIQDQEIDLDVNLANRAGRIYRQTYNRDILKDMAEIYKKVNKNPFDGIDMSGIDIITLTEEELHKELISRVDPSKFIAGMEDQTALDFEETERAGQIIWAFAKNRDKDLPGYEDWIDGFDFILPVGEILTALFEAWGKSAQPTIEIKN